MSAKVDRHRRLRMQALARQARKARSIVDEATTVVEASVSDAAALRAELRALTEQVERVVELAAADDTNHFEVKGFGVVHQVTVSMRRSDWDHGIVAAAVRARRTLGRVR